MVICRHSDFLSLKPRHTSESRQPERAVLIQLPEAVIGKNPTRGFVAMIESRYEQEVTEATEKFPVCLLLSRTRLLASL